MQDDRNVIPWYLNGWALIGALIIFWPVGLLLVLGRVKTDRSFHGAAARSLQVAGWILTVTFGIVFLIGLIGLPSESNKSIAVAGIAICLLLTVGGCILISKGAKLRRIISRRRQFISLIVNEQSTSIDSMASQLGCRVEVALASVRAMIADGFLPGFELDPDTRFVSRLVATTAASDRTAFVLFTCTGCGARNQVTRHGGSTVCEYCDLPTVVEAA